MTKGEIYYRGSGRERLTEIRGERGLSARPTEDRRASHNKRAAERGTEGGGDFYEDLLRREAAPRGRKARVINSHELRGLLRRSRRRRRHVRKEGILRSKEDGAGSEGGSTY